MNRLPEVKKFIFEDFEKKYEEGATHFKKSPGAPPVMHFLDEEGNSKKQVKRAPTFNTLQIGPFGQKQTRFHPICIFAK